IGQRARDHGIATTGGRIGGGGRLGHVSAICQRRAARIDESVPVQLVGAQTAHARLLRNKSQLAANTEVGMRVVLGKHLIGLLVAVLCAAAGCSSSKQIASLEGPLTPYSPSAVQASNAALQPEVPGAPRAATPQVNATPTSTAGTGGPINF